MDLKATELTLGLPGADSSEPRGSKRAAEEGKDGGAATKHGKEAPIKAQAVGWPPVRSFRRNAVMASKMAAAEVESGGGMFVKVSMDGAPYLRKIDLKSYKGYKELLAALEGIFKCFNIGELGKGSCKSEYALTYEDKDGDWMLVGDVPFDMFTSSCKRLRIMKGSEARGLGSG